MPASSALSLFAFPRRTHRFRTGDGAAPPSLEREDENHPPHPHPNVEMLLIRQGAIEAYSNGKWLKAGPGPVIFNASNQLHGPRNRGSEPATYFVVNFKTAATPSS